MSKKTLPKPDPGRTVTAAWLKHEGESEPGAFGPVGFTYADEGSPWRTFDPYREPDPWFSVAQAQRLAKSLGVPLEVC